jgi:hypothetical protein
MKTFEVMIPRLVRMTEWETLYVNANNAEEAKENAITYTNVISNSEWEEEDHETIERYDDEIIVRETDDEGN